MTDEVTGPAVTDCSWKCKPNAAFCICRGDKPAAPPTPAQGRETVEIEGWESTCGFLAISPFCPRCGESRTNALRARPALPADVQAAVEQAEVIARAVQSRRLERFGGMGDEPALVGDAVAQTIRTLLAHLTREAR